MEGNQVDKPSSIFNNFTDIVGSARDEGIVNLQGTMATKVTIPTGVADGRALVYNASTGRFEASQVGTTGIAPGTNGQVLTTTGGTAAWRTPITAQAVSSSSNLILTTTPSDLPGTSITFTPTGTSPFIVTTAGFYTDISVLGTTEVVGRIVLDGATIGSADISDAAGITLGIFTATAILAVSTNTLHTLKLQGFKAAAAGTATHRQTSYLNVMLFDF